MAYAKVNDIKERLTRQLSEGELSVAKALLGDVAVMIDAAAGGASAEAKRLVSIRAVIRALGDGNSYGTPLGASQGSMSGLGYSQSWTLSSGGAVGEIYLSKSDKALLKTGNRIGSYSPVENLAGGGTA